MMPTEYRTAESSRRLRGVAVALVVHLLLGWLLISGSAGKAFDVVNKPLQAVVIQDVVVAPPPPPPPKTVVPPKLMANPTQAPPFIPVAEVPVTTPTTLVVAATTVVHEAPPPAPAPVLVVAAPPAPAPAAKLDMAIVCPTQVAPEMPRRALIDGTEGMVRAQVRIADGMVREVSFLSGPRIFYASVRTAMLQYKCTRESSEVVATQEFNFKLQP
jgi:protein TonB